MSGESVGSRDMKYVLLAGVGHLLVHQWSLLMCHDGQLDRFFVSS